MDETLSSHHRPNCRRFTVAFPYAWSDGSLATAPHPLLVVLDVLRPGKWSLTDTSVQWHIVRGRVPLTKTGSARRGSRSLRPREMGKLSISYRDNGGLCLKELP